MGLKLYQDWYNVGFIQLYPHQKSATFQSCEFRQIDTLPYLHLAA